MGSLRTLGLFALCGAVGLLNGCGGGDGGMAPAAYNGVTTQASVTNTNSEALSEAAMDGAASAGGSYASVTPGGNTADKGLLMNVARSISSTMTSIDMSTAGSSPSVAAAMTSAGGTDPGLCGGSITYNFTYDDVTGAFSGSSSFANYVDCDTGGTLNGSMTMAGSFDLASATFPSMNMDFSALTFSDGVESITMTGKMVMITSSLTNYEMTMNMDFRDNVSNTTYRVANYVVNITEDAAFTYANMTIAGDAYHPEYGYVTVSTTTPVLIYYVDENPTSGVVVLTGAGGTSVTVTFTSNDTYTLGIDNNGGGIDITKNCTWSTNTCVVV